MHETLTDVASFLKSHDLTDSEKWVCHWQFGMLGHFQAALAQCIARADDGNLMALSLGFPVQVSGYRQWTQGGLGKKLRGMGLDI